LLSNAVKFTDKGRITVNIEWIEGPTQVTDESFEPIPYELEEEGIFDKNERFISSFCEEERAILKMKHNYFALALKEKALKIKSTGIFKISVTDTGCGIPEADLGKLFQRFSQVNNDNSKKQIGSGLGLYITKELILKMDGDIRVYSRKGCGTTFMVCIPTTSEF